MGQNQKSQAFYFKCKDQHVIIHNSFKMTLNIASLDTFPHGFDGLRLWQAGIVLSRYIINNSSMFKGKRVLQLGSGVGIAGFTAKKWTQCVQVDITDYHCKVIENIKQNMQKNELLCPVYELDWTNHHETPTQFQIIMGSDIVYFGCPVADLYQVFKQRLTAGGIGIIVIPVRKNYAQLFLSKIEKDIFALEIQKLDKQQYFESPLEDQQQGIRRYPLLKEIGFQVYKLTKKL